jgi:hypothetical protein
MVGTKTSGFSDKKLASIAGYKGGRVKRPNRGFAGLTAERRAEISKKAHEAKLAKKLKQNAIVN